MATLVFTSHLDGTAPGEDCFYPGTTVGAVLESAFADYPRLRHYILNDQGRLRKHVVIFLDDGQLRPQDALTTPVETSNTIYVLQALSGGQVNP